MYTEMMGALIAFALHFGATALVFITTGLFSLMASVVVAIAPSCVTSPRQVVLNDCYRGRERKVT
jgi:hypothetical protein